jgi:hypothetical protein
MNCIINNEDCTRNPESKMSPCLKRLVHNFSWQDSFSVLHPNISTFSHYYGNQRIGVGATRIDRSYNYGDLVIIQAEYVSVAFSDHLAYIVTIKVPTSLTKLICPKNRPLFKIKPETAKDSEFQVSLATKMKDWEKVKQFVPVLDWWELLVKPGIRHLAITRTKEINKERRGRLNLLQLRLSFLARKLQRGDSSVMSDLREVQILIENWFAEDCEKVKIQAKLDDIQVSEKVRIHHHEIHQKKIKQSAILKLQTDQGLLEGHSACSSYLHQTVSDLLEHPAVLDSEAQATLLSELQVVFTDADNTMLTAVPDKEEVWMSVKTSNVDSSPGTDGITSLVYRECWDILGDAMTEVVQAVFSGEQPTLSQRTSLMVFSAKPKKLRSLKPGDKRRLSMLNSDFKVITGVELGRYNKVVTHTLCPQQLAVGGDRRITHGICMARDAIFAAGKAKISCGMQDNDYEAAFDFLCLSWVGLVMTKMGLAKEAVSRFFRLYRAGITIPVINNILGDQINNNRLSLRQGDRPSGIWFCFGIEPLLIYLERRLKGILIHSSPVLGPTLPDQPRNLPHLETRYKVVGYLDDCKPAICNEEEFELVDKTSLLFESSSGCKLHRNPDSNKCKILMMGKWKEWNQDQVPLPYLKLTDHLDYLGCKLFSSYNITKRENGINMQKMMEDQMRSWKSGKFMPLSSRPWSISSYCTSRLWYRACCLDFRVGDCNKITSTIKSWLYQDMLEKPPEFLMYRHPDQGGLGVTNVRVRAQALLIHSFLQQAISPTFLRNNYYNVMFRWHVLEERGFPNPGRPPYYSAYFFSTIQDVHLNTPHNVGFLSIKGWYVLLMERSVTHTNEDPDSPPLLISSTIEDRFPEIDHQRGYRVYRPKELTPDQMSFNFKLKHNILPTKERLFRLKKVPNNLCNSCDLTEDQTHFLCCLSTREVTAPLLLLLHTYMDSLTLQQLVSFDFSVEGQAVETPLVWITTTCLIYLWETRRLGRPISYATCRAELLANFAVLKNTKFVNFKTVLSEILETHFPLHNPTAPPQPESVTPAVSSAPTGRTTSPPSSAPSISGASGTVLQNSL